MKRISTWKLKKQRKIEERLVIYRCIRICLFISHTPTIKHINIIKKYTYNRELYTYTTEIVYNRHTQYRKRHKQLSSGSELFKQPCDITIYSFCLDKMGNVLPIQLAILINEGVLSDTIFINLYIQFRLFNHIFDQKPFEYFKSKQY